MSPVIEFHDVSKRYLIGSGGRSLRRALSALPQHLLGRPPLPLPELWALKDVTFDIQQGQSIGFLGHNGAGKTTVLKLLSGITMPTYGSIQVSGRVGTLIELGAGFHPEMTGRENVYLNGVILGMTRQEVAQRFDSIAAFAEIDQFLDTPVKRYSSGMYVRLAFAVAAHIDPAVLLVDEVLAVGDIGFRAKCYRRMAELRKNGTTVVLVAHDVNAIRDTCDQAILLWQGELIEKDSPDKVITTYLTRMQTMNSGRAMDDGLATQELSELRYTKAISTKATIQAVVFRDCDGTETDTIKSGQPLQIEISYTVEEPIWKPIFRVDLYRQGSLHTGVSTAYDGLALEPLHDNGTTRLYIDHVSLAPGVYSVSVVIADTFEYNLLDVHHQAYPLQVVRSETARGDVALPHKWHFCRGQRIEDQIGKS